MYSSLTRWAIGVLLAAFESLSCGLIQPIKMPFCAARCHLIEPMETAPGQVTRIDPPQSKIASSFSSRLHIRALSTDSGSPGRLLSRPIKWSARCRPNFEHRPPRTPPPPRPSDSDRPAQSRTASSSPPRWVIGVISTAFESPYCALDQATHPVPTHTLPHLRTFVEVGDSDRPTPSKSASSSSTPLHIRTLSTDSGSSKRLLSRPNEWSAQCRPNFEHKQPRTSQAKRLG